MELAAQPSSEGGDASGGGKDELHAASACSDRLSHPAAGSSADVEYIRGRSRCRDLRQTSAQVLDRKLCDPGFRSGMPMRWMVGLRPGVRLPNYQLLPHATYAAHCAEDFVTAFRSGRVRRMLVRCAVWRHQTALVGAGDGPRRP